MGVPGWNGSHSGEFNVNRAGDYYPFSLREAFLDKDLVAVRLPENHFAAQEGIVVIFVWNEYVMDSLVLDDRG